MKKRTCVFFSLALMCCLLLTIPVLATLQWSETKLCDLHLGISGSTASCYLDVEAFESDANITATIKLQKKGLFGIYTTKEKWEDVTATGTLNFYDTYSPVDEGEYRLTADIEVVGSGGSDSISRAVTETK